MNVIRLINRKKNISATDGGFSLVELIVVILIIGILAVVLAPAVIKYQKLAAENSARYNLNEIANCVQIAHTQTLVDAKQKFDVRYPNNPLLPPPKYTEAEKQFVETLKATLPADSEKYYFIAVKSDGASGKLAIAVNYFPNGNQKEGYWQYLQGEVKYIENK